MVDEDLLNSLRNLEFERHAPVLHGMVCGCAAAGVERDAQQWQAELSAWFNDESLDPLLGAVLADAAREVARGLADPELTLKLLLPGDDADLRVRKLEIAHWCQGFLEGFAAERGFDRQPLSADVREILADMQQIAQLSDGADTDDDEADLMQVEEYLKIGCLLVFTECALGQRSPS